MDISERDVKSHFLFSINYGNETGNNKIVHNLCFMCICGYVCMYLCTCPFMCVRVCVNKTDMIFTKILSISFY